MDEIIFSCCVNKKSSKVQRVEVLQIVAGLWSEKSQRLAMEIVGSGHTTVKLADCPALLLIRRQW